MLRLLTYLSHLGGLAVIHKARMTVLAEAGGGHVEGDGLSDQNALLAPLLGHQRQSSLDGIGGVLELELLAVQRDGAAGLLVGAEQRLAQFGLAAADQAGQTDDFALADVGRRP